MITRLPRLPRDLLEPSKELTAREREVAALVAEGMSNPEIAERLVLTDTTVHNHVQSIRRKLGARHPRHLTAMLAGQRVT